MPGNELIDAKLDINLVVHGNAPSGQISGDKEHNYPVVNTERIAVYLLREPVAHQRKLVKRSQRTLKQRNAPFPDVLKEERLMVRQLKAAHYVYKKQFHGIIPFLPRSGLWSRVSSELRVTDMPL